MNKKDNTIILFNEKQVRRRWDENKEFWYFSVIDVISILTDSTIPKRYWADLKKKLKNEGSKVYDKIVQLKFKARDGKYYASDCFSTEDLLRLIQSIPSPKAEPFKLWLAKIGNDRINESQDPEIAIDRAMIYYRNLGYSEEWINARLQSIQFRKELTDEWDRTGVKEGIEFAILTNIMTEEWAGKTIKDYKKIKGLKKENLRDNMTSLELALNILAETSTTELSKTMNPKSLDKNKDIARRGGKIAGDARKNIESQTKKPVISSKNAKGLRLGD
ncbi:MAG TPA: BRO family protein [Patescibacteria group bacterium]|nr:BRO family protein [Patescibacteria group bacterium]